MKSYYLIALLLVAFACSNYGNETSDAQSQPEATPSVEEETFVEKPAVCIWDKVSVRSNPQAKGDWLTSISQGETLTFLGPTAVDSSDNNREYVNVRLADGTEGWSVSDFIIVDGEVAVFTSDKDIYQRPDLLTKTDKSFKMLDIVAISIDEGDWLEVVGKREDGKWIQKGWVKNGEISKESIDVAVAKFASIAIASDMEEDQIEGLQDILSNTDFSSSTFIPFIKEKLNEFQEEDEALMDEEMETDSTALNDDI